MSLGSSLPTTPSPPQGLQCSHWLIVRWCFSSITSSKQRYSPFTLLTSLNPSFFFFLFLSSSLLDHSATHLAQLSSSSLPSKPQLWKKELASLSMPAAYVLLQKNHVPRLGDKMAYPFCICIHQVGLVCDFSFPFMVSSSGYHIRVIPGFLFCKIEKLPIFPPLLLNSLNSIRITYLVQES